MEHVSAIIVTRGDVDLAPIIGQDWPDAVDEIVVWDNSKEQDLAVYGRYAAIERAKNPLIFMMDDDVLLPRESIDQIIEKWDDSRSYDFAHPDYRVPDPPEKQEHVVCNMPARFRDQPQYERGDQALVGFGGCFHRDAPARAFDRLQEHFDAFPFLLHHAAAAASFHRTCDIVFTGLTPRVLVDVPYEDLPHAHASNRMWKTEGHVEERMRMLELVRRVRDNG